MAMALLAHMDEEVDLLDQLEQEIQSQGWSGPRETYANGNADVEIAPGGERIRFPFPPGQSGRRGSVRASQPRRNEGIRHL
eukprot:8621266-Pyramimonas_sp.AAC.1